MIIRYHWAFFLYWCDISFFWQ